MDEAEGLSEADRALLEREGWSALGLSPQMQREFGRLLAAARAESRSTPDREGAGLTADMTRALPGVMDDATYAQVEEAPDRIDAPIREFGDHGRFLKLHERVAALARPASSAGGVEEALVTRVSEALKRAEHVESRSCEVRIDDLRTMLAALTSKGADRG